MAMEWWKFSTDMFDNEKIQLIETTQKNNADMIILVWIRLLNLSAKLNNKGIFKIENKGYPIDTICQMLHKTGKKGRDMVLLALNVLASLKMISYEDGIIEIKNWGKYQSQDKYDEMLEKNRERQQKFRNKKKNQSNINPELQAILGQVNFKK